MYEINKEQNETGLPKILVCWLQEIVCQIVDQLMSGTTYQSRLVKNLLLIVLSLHLKGLILLTKLILPSQVGLCSNKILFIIRLYLFIYFKTLHFIWLNLFSNIANLEPSHFTFFLLNALSRNIPYTKFTFGHRRSISWF